MSQQFIYIIGKPAPDSEFLRVIRKLGYKAGVLLDSTVKIKNPESYDRIERLDFYSLDDELERLLHANLDMAGVVCTYENYIIAQAKIGELFNVPALSLDSAQKCTDKLLMRQAFRDHNPSITPQFQVANSLADVTTFTKRVGFPVILKPTNLVKSLLVLKCHNEEELIANFNFAKQSIHGLYKKLKIYDRQPQLIIEECISGQACSIAAFVDHNGQPHFCDGITQLTTAQDVKINDNFLYSRQLPARFDVSTSSHLFEVARQGILALGIRSTPAHVELMYQGDDVKIIEIGARIGGYRPRMYEYSYGLDLIKQEIRLSIGLTPEVNGKFQSYSAVYELFPSKIGAFQGIKCEPELRELGSVTYVKVKAKPGDIVGKSSEGYKAAAFIALKNTNYRQFVADVDFIEKNVKITTTP